MQGMVFNPSNMLFSKFIKLSVFFVSFLFLFVFFRSSSALAATSPVLVGSASYSVLAGTTVTCTGATTVTGDVGVAAGAAITGFPVPCVVSPGSTHSNDASAIAAQADNLTAFGTLDAAANADANCIGGVLPSGTDLTLLSPLVAGLYCSAGSFLLTGNLTFTGSGVWVFKTVSTLITSPGSSITGGDPCNIWWRIGSSATLDTTTSFKGNILALMDINLNTGADLNGRAMVQTGQVVLDDNQISGPACFADLHVIKTVVGGTAVPSDFNVHVTFGAVDVLNSPISSPQLGVASPGTLYSLPAGAYVVDEDVNSAYTKSFSGACNLTSSVTLLADDDVTCTITNTLIVAPPPSGGGGGGGHHSKPTLPIIGVTKTPSPSSIKGESGSVTYSYTVWNVGGKKALKDITIKDDKCSSLVLLSGDTDKDNKIDILEKWKYSCTMILSKTTTNIVTATGYSDDTRHLKTVDTATATVVVGTLKPMVNIEKTPSRLTPFPFGGGDVTYTYVVTNPGALPHSNVKLSDDKCAKISSLSGDGNTNGLLESSETWKYSCQTRISVTTRNTVVVTAEANGLVVTDSAIADVFVGTPGLPNTGLPPEKHIPWSIVLGTGLVLILTSALFFFKRKKV